MELTGYKTYKELDVWIKYKHLAKEVYAVTTNFPKEEMYGLTSQIRRSVVSIASNIAEGYGRQYKKETIEECRRLLSGLIKYFENSNSLR
jgi:23S rRNA-intervening sequence protein